MPVFKIMPPSSVKINLDTSKFIPYCIDNFTKWKEFDYDKSGAELSNGFSFKFMSRCFAEIEGSERCGNPLAVSGIIVSPLTFIHFRNLGQTFFDQATTRETIISGIFGHLWTADIYSTPKMNDSHVLLFNEPGDKKIEPWTILKAKIPTQKEVQKDGATEMLEKILEKLTNIEAALNSK